MLSGLTKEPFEQRAANSPAPTTDVDSQLPQPIIDLIGSSVITGVLDRLMSISVSDKSGRILHVNSEFLRISGYERHELIGKNHRILNSGYHPSSFFASMYQTIQRGKQWRATIRNKAKDGSYYWVDTLIWPLKGAGNAIVGYLSVRLEITGQVNLHIKLEERNRLLEAVIKEFPGGIAAFDVDLNMVLCNDRQKQLLDYPESLFENGSPSFEKLVRLNAERGEYGPGCVEEQTRTRVALARKCEPHVFERVRPNGRHLEVRGAPMEGGGFISTHLDITERKRNEKTIKRLAQFDALTGLANRTVLRDRMMMAVARCKRGDSLALHYLDLDGFKSVNDSCGHATGDQLLHAVGARLRRTTREMDTVSRIGGDEFVVLQQGARTRDDAAALADRLVKELSRPYEIGSQIVEIGTSIGIAMAPSDTLEPDELLACADLALYHAKDEARGSYSFFTADMDQRARSRRSIESALRRALANQQFELHYQPIINTQNGRVTSFEALLRWRHPERGLVSPGEFIPIAEKTGLMGPLGDWVLQQAVADARSWPDTVSVSVNVSGAQFRKPGFAKKVDKACQDISPSRLILEITESILLQNNTETLDELKEIHSLGVRFALDDFGTGYASLSYLQSFPFDSLKIDRSFVSSQCQTGKSKALLATIADLGRALGLSTVAEGVETQQQYSMIKAHGCSQAQGFLFSKPVPASELAHFFE